MKSNRDLVRNNYQLILQKNYFILKLNLNLMKMFK